MSNQLLGVFFIYAPYCILIPLWLSFQKRNYQQSYSRPLFFYFLVATIVQAASYVLWLLKVNNLPLLHLYTPLEFLLVTYIFYSVSSSERLKLLLKIICIAFLFFSLINSLFIQSVYRFNSYAKTLESFFLILICINWFFNTLTDVNGYQKPFAWMASGFLIYFSGSLLLYVLSNYLLSFVQQWQLYAWYFHTFLLLVQYILTVVGLCYVRRN